MNNIELGKFLAKLRTESNLTQEQLSEMLHIDKRKISRWECGNSAPEFDLLIKLTEIFNVTLYEISICQRLEKPSLIEKTKSKFKTIKDLKKLDIKKKILIILSILLGIFFILTTIYTINNYHTVEIYTLKSLDDDFRIEGSYIEAKDYNLLSITSMKYVNKNTKALDINVYNIEYIVLDYDKNHLHKIINNKIENEKNQLNLLDNINNFSFSKENLNNKFDKNNNLIFRINYQNKNNEVKNIDFKFYLRKKFNN